MPIFYKGARIAPRKATHDYDKVLLDFRMWLIAQGYTLSPDPDDGQYSGSYVTGARRFLEFLAEENDVSAHS